jgi:hypothetical protein
MASPSLAMPRAELVRLCLVYGATLEPDLRGSDDELGNEIDGPRMLWAIAGRESSFGKNLGPRFEPAYYIGGKLWMRSLELQAGVSKYGRAFACSYGPLQIMAVNAKGFSLEEISTDMEKATQAAVARIRTDILRRQRAKKLSEICDAWNTGNFRDTIVPTDYIAEVRHHYITEVLA